jgi:hypothetical protein
MATKIKVSTEITEALEKVIPGDVVQNISNKTIILVTETENNGMLFNGMVLDRGNYNELVEKDYVRRRATPEFKRYLGSVTLDSF